MPLWQKLLWLALAGAVGTLARYGLQGLVPPYKGFPLGVFIVNMVGTLTFGVIWGLWGRSEVSDGFWIIATAGFMGAFTTFSSFMFETGQLLKDGQYLYAAGNLIGQNVIGIICLFLGKGLGNYL